ncbi:hypothetical protein [Sutcliffiella halmapala]|uniref:hypothetical protein n=1 Tax=Sutcliffiella halmapala TaxID=79882 RepID=UPI0014757688|nr:hypothetical protein [Sutcliffiella halmapala]
MKEHLSNMEKLGEEEVLLPILDKMSNVIVTLTAIVGVPFILFLLLQFSFLFF